jgi:hypothetical protein
MSCWPERVADKQSMYPLFGLSSASRSAIINFVLIPVVGGGRW